jgi:osmotically-inducible protein OsmY
MKRAVLMLAALGAASLSSGCAVISAGSAATAGVFAIQNRTPGQDLDDAAISSKIKAHLLAFDGRAFARVDVEVALSEVLLSGTTPTDQDRTDAGRIAAAVIGVQKVDNQLLVGRNESLPGSAHDEWVTARVRTKLLADKSIKGIDFNIETHAGVVYLMGLARTADEARRVAEAASYVGGVTKVVSYIRLQEQTAGADVATTGAPIETLAQAPVPRLAAQPAHRNTY